MTELSCKTIRLTEPENNILKSFSNEKQSQEIEFIDMIMERLRLIELKCDSTFARIERKIEKLCGDVESLQNSLCLLPDGLQFSDGYDLYPNFTMGEDQIKFRGENTDPKTIDHLHLQAPALWGEVQLHVTSKCWDDVILLGYSCEDIITVKEFLDAINNWCRQRTDDNIYKLDKYLLADYPRKDPFYQGYEEIGYDPASKRHKYKLFICDDD